ncbi:RHS repeat domain-containing protein, partial [Neisseria canis]
FYDDFGNTIHKEHSDGSTQNLHYDLFDRLVKMETFKKNAKTGEWDKEVWAFEYDALDRRVSKDRLKAENGKDIIDSEITFLWDGSHLLQETHSDGLYTYIYTDQDSYEPLAQIHNYTNTESESKQEINYFHCDQIGIPREMTDKNGKLLWLGEYDAWGKLTKETNVTGRAHQPFRLQNQYCDSEIRLHYNFFRYYDPDVGRFINQDPIGLLGGNNLYHFAPNRQVWIDPLGLNPLVGLNLSSMNRQQIADVLSKSENISWRGGSPDGRFMQWNYTDTGKCAVRLDPPDDKTPNDHAHLYDRQGNSLDIKGNIVDRTSPDAHIPILPN